MAYSDRLVFQALETLIQAHGEGAIIRHEEIQDKAGTSHNTTGRALKRLVNAQKVERQFVNGVGYRYSIPGVTVTRRR